MPDRYTSLNGLDTKRDSRQSRRARPFSPRSIAPKNGSVYDYWRINPDSFNNFQEVIANWDAEYKAQAQ